jgi:hypothetical protein
LQDLSGSWKVRWLQHERGGFPADWRLRRGPWSLQGESLELHGLLDWRGIVVLGIIAFVGVLLVLGLDQSLLYQRVKLLVLLFPRICCCWRKVLEVAAERRGVVSFSLLPRASVRGP